MKNELTNDPTWIIDPVDGTLNFVHSFPYTCISIGFWVNKAANFGIVYNPVLDQMFTARKGMGAFLNGNPIKVSGETGTILYFKLILSMILNILFSDIKKALVFTEMGTRHDPQKMEVVFKNFHSIMKHAQG